MKRRSHFERKKARAGYVFVLPWVIGFLLFFLIPIVNSLIYTFNDVKLSANGFTMNWVGFSNYQHLLLKDASYPQLLGTAVGNMLYEVVIVTMFSLLVAVILNQKFHGRTFYRAVFFLPVIIGSSVVMSQLSGFSMQQDIMASSGVGGEQQVAEYMNVIDFNALQQRLNLPSSINSLLAGYLQDTFNLIWSCGIQILLFVAGLQTIPEQLYEVGKVEGITAWEKFWYITVPMMGRVILLVIFYTMVELFMEKGTLVNRAVTTLMEQNYTTSSAMLWPYFALVGIIIGLVVFLYNRWCLRRWE